MRRKEILQKKSRSQLNGPGNRKINISKNTNPNCSKTALVSVLIGMMVNSNFEPSKGGIGIKLKTAKRIFQKIAITQIVKKIFAKDPDIM